MTGPTKVDLALTFTPLAPAALSILGASATLYNILSDPDRRFTTPYFRIMACLSFADITYSIAKMGSSFAVPENTPGVYFASGNQATCSVQGFFLLLGMIQPLYIMSLSINYLMVIKYSKSDEFLAKKLEPWMHAVSLGYPLIGSVVCVSLGYFNPLPNGCWIFSYPLQCEGANCIRGKHYYEMNWIFGGSVLCTTFIVVIFCMVQVVLFVRKRLIVMQRQFRFGNHSISTCKNLEKQYRASTKQALLYVAAFVLVWMFGFLFRVNRHARNVYLLIPAQVLNPLQGFFNFFIYICPRYAKSKEEFPEKSFWWLMKDSIITTTKTKVTRRRLSDCQMRTMKKRRSILLRKSRREQEAYGQQNGRNPSSTEGVIETHPDFQSPLEVIDDAVYEEEPLTMLQSLQRLHELNDSDLDSDETVRVEPEEQILANEDAVHNDVFATNEEVEDGR